MGKKSGLVCCFTGLLLVLLVSGVYYTAYHESVYCPRQPINFSHKKHVEELGMDCSACHTGIGKSAMIGIPDGASCIDCHRHIKANSPDIQLVRRSADKNAPYYTGEPIEWKRVNSLGNQVQFDHRVHVLRGVGCVTCHGDVSKMDEMQAPSNRGMTWCMDCHREPSMCLRPLDQITSMNAPVFKKGDDSERLLKQWSIHPRTDCTACHQ